MSEYEELSQVVTTLATGMGELASNTAKIPPAIDRLEAKISALGLTPAQKAQLQADISALKTLGAAAANASGVLAQAAADAADDVDESIVVPPPPPAPLTPPWADRAAFDVAVAAYTGTEQIALDGAPVKPGTSGLLDFYSHSDSTPPGMIDALGPTS